MRFTPIVVLSMVSLTISACSLDDLLNGDKPLEGTIVDPTEVSTYEGAVGQYYAAIQAMSSAIGLVSEDVGLITDELSLMKGDRSDFDSRNPISGAEGLYSRSYDSLQAARVRAAHASELLLRYGTAASYPLVGHAYALQAHAILLMAELFCSGVPLTNVPFEGGIAFTEGLSTTTLLNRAVALFDTAYQYGKDSLPIATFARVGQGRALLSLGKYSEAAEVVGGVPTDARYSIAFSALAEGVKFWADPIRNLYSRSYIVASREGNNGIDWVAATPRQQDPRLPLSTTADSSAFMAPLRQLKYQTASETMIVADGIQARMIEAEAQLQPPNAPRGPWLATLNMVRHTRGLDSLTDPGTAEKRVDLVFRERGFWFYLNGQRLGDMRRLVRNYGRLPGQVYATGGYPLLYPPTYGKEYVFMLPKTEQQYNPLYKGCIHKEP